MSRLAKLEVEEDYFIFEYKKELEMIEFYKNKKNVSPETSASLKANNLKRKRGKVAKNQQESNSNHAGPSISSELVIRNRLFTRRGVFDSENESEIGGQDNSRGGASTTGAIGASSYLNDEETIDNFIDIDEDSNTHQSMPGRRPGPEPSNFYRHLTSEESEDSSEYSDWAEEDGRRTLKPPPRKNKKQKQQRKQPRRTLRIQDDDEDVEPDDEEVEVKKKPGLTKKLRKILSDDEEEEEEETEAKKKESEEEEEDIDEDEVDEEAATSEDQDDDLDISDRPCTSKSTSPKKRPKKKMRTKAKISKTKIKTPKSSSPTKSLKKETSAGRDRIAKHLDFNGIKECPPEYRPPEWLTSSKAKRSPYVPQIGDEVVYFRQGHELYAEAVRSVNAYEIDESSLPWSLVEVQEYCKVNFL